MHYVVSDVHGHVGPLVDALRQAGLIDADRGWAGGEARLTFMGDYFDRGPDGVGTVDFIRQLQVEAGASGGNVEALIGNHEILALGMNRFGDQRLTSDFWGGSTFADSWARNGGKVRDQERLTDEHRSWLCGLDSVLLVGSNLLLHSDITEYLDWGSVPQEINDGVREVLAGDDLGQWWDCWVTLTGRHAFAGPDGERVATGLLDRLGGERIVHGHSIISTFTRQSVSDVTGPLSYAGGRALAVDGGLFAGGPCLVVGLDDDA
jgi:hypothetical protein